MKLNLRGKILFPTILVVLIGLTLSGFLNYRSSKKALEGTINAELASLTGILAKQLEGWIDGLAKDIELCARRDDIRNALNATGEEQQTAATSGSAFLEAMVKKYGGQVSRFHVLGPDGVAVASSDSTSVGKLDLGQREYFRQSISEGKTVVSEVLKSKVSGNPIFAISVPVFAGTRVAGVLVGVVELFTFTEHYITPIKIGSRGYLYVLDDQGRFIAHPNKDNILDVSVAEHEWGKEVLNKKKGFTLYKWEGIDKLLVYEQVPSTGWIVVACAENRDVFSAIDSIRKQSIFVALILLAVLAGVVFLVVRPIVNDVRLGVRFAETVSLGDLSERLQLARHDEIGQLGQALDGMADSLQAKARIADQIAQGNLAVEVQLASEGDQLGKALQGMTANLNQFMSEVNLAGEQIASGSAQISDSSQSLSQGATESAASLEQITASMTEMGSQTRQTADNATQADQLAGQAKAAAETGNERMQEMVAAMDEINQAGQNISKIIKVIDEIAFQTNLLALNAAVEAARAGQHGKGFAVVAEEVRNLAARSAKAAKETAELIEGSVQKTQNGTEIAGETETALEEIVSGIVKVCDLVKEIAAAAGEQAEGIGQVNIGLGQIDSVTQQNTANAEESAAAAEELSGQAEELRRMLSRFKVGGAQPAKLALVGGSKDMKRQLPLLPASSAANGSSSSQQKPSAVIALDDSEFGKY